jgi:hypothetical protein
LIIAAIAASTTPDVTITRPTPPSAAPQSPSEEQDVVPVSGVCPTIDALAPVLPDGAPFALVESGRGVEDGVVNCFYIQSTADPATAPYILIAVQDDLAIQSVDDYFASRDLTPPTAAQLGGSAGAADLFGFDEYIAPGTSQTYIDTGAATGQRSAVVTVPQAFGIPVPDQFALAVTLLDAISTPSNVV